MCSSDLEVHDHPSQALSDAAQQLTPAQFTKLVAQAKKIHALTENHD